MDLRDIIIEMASLIQNKIPDELTVRKAVSFETAEAIYDRKYLNGMFTMTTGHAAGPQRPKPTLVK